MTRRATSAGSLAAGALLLASVMTPPGAHAAIVLGGPQVLKLDWNTRSLAAGDIDGDGLTDLAVLNNDRARIDLLLQLPEEATLPPAPSGEPGAWNPVLDDARFRRESITTGVIMYALSIGDLDSDGRADLAYTTKRGRLSLRFQAEDGTWKRLRTFEIGNPVQWISSLRIADIDGDDRDDLLLLVASHLLILRQDAEGGMLGPARYPLANRECYGLMVRDLNNDGRPDVIYLAQHSNRAWRVRFQTAPGEFGPEQAFRLPSPGRSLAPLDIGLAATPGFATIDPATRRLDLVTLAIAPPATTLDDYEPRPRFFAAAGNGKTPASYGLGDLDGDGRVDIVDADAGAARVLVHLQTTVGGFSEPRAYPSFSDVRSLAALDVDGDGRAELFALSRKEQVVGMSRLTAAGRLTYPEPLPTRGQPLALAAGDLGPPHGVAIVYARVRDERREVAVVTPRAGGNWKEQSIPLDGPRTDPLALEIVDANQDGRGDLAVFTLQSPVRFLLQDGAGRFRQVSAGDGFRQGLLDRVLPAGLTPADIDGDGVGEMLVAGTGFARALRIDASGQLEILDQYNAHGTGTTIATSAALDLDGDGHDEIILVERGGQTMQVLSPDTEGVYRYRRSVEMGKLALVNSLTPDLDGNGASDLLLLGTDRFWWLPTARADWARKQIGSYETTLDDVHYSDLATGDLDGDGRDEIVVADTVSTHRLEILSSDAGGALTSRLHFTIFDADPHYSGRQGTRSEPRQMQIVDVTGDGRDDLVLLIHDRVLIYPQE
ncbi:MAG: FG-GAP repeat domain-containing protein [Acidobacteriota bacterium]